MAQFMLLLRDNPTEFAGYSASEMDAASVSDRDETLQPHREL